LLTVFALWNERVKIMPTGEGSPQELVDMHCGSSGMTPGVREKIPVTSLPEATRASEAKSTAKRSLSYLLFTLCVGLYLLPFMRVLLQGTDEGLLFYGAVRVANGQVFARDFFEIVGPGTFYWLAMFFKMFGVTFMAAHFCLFLTSLGTGLLMYFLSRRVCRRYQALPCVILAGTSFGMMWPTISHHADSSFFALLTVAFIILWLDKRAGLLLFAAGGLAGITTFFLQPKGVLLLAALLLWLWLQLRRRSASILEVGWLIAGYGGVVAIVLVYFWNQHALWDLFNANVLFPSRYYSEVNTVPYAQGIQDYWHNWTGSGMRWMDVVAVVLITPFLFVAVLPGLLPALGVLKAKRFSKPEITLYWMCGLALWLAEYHRKDIYHLVFGSPLLIILCVFYLQEYGAKTADAALQILAIGSTSLAAFNLFLVLSAESTTTRVGSVAMFRKDPMLTQVEGRVAPGEEIFVYPSDPIYYFLTETRNPIRYSGLMYNYNSREEFEEVVQILDRHRIKYVVWDSEFMDRDLKMFFPSAKPMRPDELIVEPYLESHYKTVWRDGGTLLMERKSDEHASN
jgi:hypothetical protein